MRWLAALAHGTHGDAQYIEIEIAKALRNGVGLRGKRYGMKPFAIGVPEHNLAIEKFAKHAIAVVAHVAHVPIDPFRRSAEEQQQVRAHHKAAFETFGN